MEYLRKRNLIVQRRVNGKLAYYAENGTWTKKMHRAKRHKEVPTYGWLSYQIHRIIEI